MVKKRKKLRIGFDFDGVIAYSPTRLLRAPISWVKRKILKKKGLKFFVPKKNWQMIIWAFVFGPSVLPEPGLEELKKLANNQNVRMDLVTGRFDFLERSMGKWLVKHRIDACFKTINVNSNSEQPHLFKERLIEKFKCDYFIEDNWDAVEYLSNNCKGTKILWIYNVVDRKIEYKNKFPDLKKALEYVIRENIV